MNWVTNMDLAKKQWEDALLGKLSDALLCKVDEASKAETIRKSMPGYIGADFAKKAHDDDDVIGMADLKDELAAIHNSQIKPIKDKINALRKKYKLKAEK